MEEHEIDGDVKAWVKKKIAWVKKWLKKIKEAKGFDREFYLVVASIALILVSGFYDIAMKMCAAVALVLLIWFLILSIRRLHNKG